MVRPTVADMTATTVDSSRTAVGVRDPAGAPLDAQAIDALLAGTGYVLEVERWPDEHPAGLFDADDAELRDAVEDGFVTCYEVTLSTATGTQLSRAQVWSTAGVVCGPYTTCSALGTALSEELAADLGRVLLRA